MAESTLFDVDDTLTVGQINRRLGEAVRRSFPKEVWVHGQIRNLSRSARGHVYFDLVDPVPAGAQPKSSIAVTLFDSTRQVVNRIIKRTGNSVRIDDGVEVRIKASVELYTPRGQVQLNMMSIDPEFTLGRLGADRDQLLLDLKAEGLITSNGDRELPLVPLRVGLITSGGSAAHADFHEQIAASGYAFAITTLSTRVQGEFAPEEVAAMIVQGNSLDLDVLAVVRGGGARTDLAAFDSEAVARAIATSALPVLSGIGHEIDSSVADTVAHAALKTPTACAQYLIERVIAFDFVLADRAERIAQAALVLPQLHSHRISERCQILNNRVASTLHNAAATTNAAASGLERRVVRAIARSEQRLTTTQSQIVSGAASALIHARRHSDRRDQELAERPTRLLRNESQRLELLEAKLSAVDPAQALTRGYSITTTAAGRLVRSSDHVEIGEELTTRLAHGMVRSTVTATNPESTSDQPSSPTSASPTKNSWDSVS